MQLDGLLSILRQSPRYTDLLSAVRAKRAAADQRILRAARPFVIGALAADLGVPTLVVASTVDRAYNLTEQLPVWLPRGRILRLAEPGAAFYDRTPWNSGAIRSRLGVLGALLPAIGAEVSPAPLIVTSALALMTRTLPPREFRAASRYLRPGGQIDPEKLLRHWLAIGYTPASIVTEPGTFSRRGGIIDVFPSDADQPARLELFGDEIDSIRAFDPATQRSVGSITGLPVMPAREVLPKLLPPVAERLADWLMSQPPPEEDVTSAGPDLHDLRSEAAFPALEFYLPFAYSEPTSLLDYLPENALVMVDDWGALADAVSEIEAHAVNLRADKLRAKQLPADAPLPYLPWDTLREALVSRRPLHLAGVGLHEGDDILPDGEAAALGDLFRPGPRYGGQLRTFLDALHAIREQNGLPIVVSSQAQRLAELWRERGGGQMPVSRLSVAPHTISFVEGTLTEGWRFAPQHESERPVHLFSDAEIFGWRRPEPRRHQIPRAISPEAYFADMAPGDYVVHVEYGIGRFTGLQKRQLDGATREYLLVQFAGSDVLYVPIHQADRLSRYIGADDRAPNLSRLGSGEWAQTKETARRAAEAVAKDLLELYARRASISGFTFGPDTPWQAELEASFPYIETEDQITVLAEVKADMERAMPMDRLICGDVGYGKTEIALRAAFKAVMEGKQVAVLVPTTVLAQQHYNTFAQRMAAFPVRVEMLSRFRSPREQRETLARALRGEVDILIGTHRLLQEDVAFRDLGLVIIDEEQRFGVTHKEHLKQMRAAVDVLTLTATPIPRTLYMSLAGIRDISMIQTPPAERLPVLTHVGPYDEKLVRQAVLRELDRGGQIFFVHNRVSTIRGIADHLARLVPEARVVIGHGQMHEDELEEVMTRFAAGEYDILLCTTIIESGLDIPNANTIIIDRADTMGLAQLYQLRGRVGRGAARGYGYLFYPRGTHLTADSRARLDTIAEQTELGAGLSIAMRDLEIRGAGELLGMRQSGYIAAVGFHLYTQLLSRAVQQLRRMQPDGAKPPEPALPAASPETHAPLFLSYGPSAVTIDLPVPGYVPVDFMPEVKMRVQFYRRLADLHTLAAVDEVEAELADRFGALPVEVKGLLFQIRVKLLAQTANVTAIGSDDQQISIRLPYLAEIDRAALQRYLGAGVRVSRVAVWLIRDQDWQNRLLTILGQLQPSAESGRGAALKVGQAG